MHEFNNNWLIQREKIDSLSRSKIAISKINNFIKNKDKISIIDLGCGTGSNYRYLSPKIKKKQSWDMLDISLKSINYFKEDISKSKKVDNVKFIKTNVIKNIKKIDFNNYDIVTGSAFLDIMPNSWFRDFYNLNINSKIIYFSINYDGFFKFFPKHKDDGLVLKLFNSDQKSDKGIGLKAVGPNCSKIINSMFTKTHKTFILKSDWKVENNKDFQLTFIKFCEDVVSKSNKNYKEWIHFRKDNILKNKSKIILRNKDFLALKF